MYMVVVAPDPDRMTLKRLANAAEVGKQFRFDEIVNQRLPVFGTEYEVDVNLGE